MRIQLITVLLSLLFTIASATGKKNAFHDVVDITGLKKGELVIAIYQSAGSCSKCYALPSEVIYSLNNNPDWPGAKVIAFVSCKRKKELQVFKDIYSWPFYMMRDNGHIKEDLGVPRNSEITLFDYSGKVLASISEGDFSQAEKILLESAADIK